MSFLLTVTVSSTRVFPLSNSLLSMEMKAFHNNQGEIKEKPKVNTVVKHRSLAVCVRSETELHAKVVKAPSDVSTLTPIDVCSSPITLQKEINFTNKNVEIQCELSNRNQKRVIDANSKTRHFNFRNSIVSFKNLDFVNEKATWESNILLQTETASGGSFYIYNSSVSMVDCGF
jgi:hypothetical protein